jgi:four helix bundle protein
MTEFQLRLKKVMSEFVHFVYNVTQEFPKEELYNSVSQWRRATLSVVLNYVEGYARRKALVQLNFFEISYGSLEESKYLLNFALERKYIDNERFQQGQALSEEIGRMLWTEIKSVEKRAGLN